MMKGSRPPPRPLSAAPRTPWREVLLKYRRQNLSLDPARSAKKRRGAIVILPTLFTLGNCLCGFASLHYAARPTEATPLFASNYAVAGYLIFAGMFFDLFDGFFARLARATSDFGAELDSLADMVSFGIAPAFLALRLINDVLQGQYAPLGERAPWAFVGPNADNALGKLFWIVGALYVVCTALRLARFNVFNKHEESAHMAFRGLPSPGAAGVVASSIIFFESLYATKHYLPFSMSEELIKAFRIGFSYCLPAILLVSGLLMVSRFTYAHLINRFLRGRRRFNYLVFLVLILMLLLWEPRITTLLFIYIYALSAPVSWLYRSIFGRPSSSLPPSAPPPSTPSPPPEP